MDRDGYKIIESLLKRKDPSSSLLFQVELLGKEALDVLCEKLESGLLSDRQAYRALQGLAYATKHLGYEDHKRELEAALSLVGSQNISLRSRAVHTIISAIDIMKNLQKPTYVPGNDLNHITNAIQEALRLGIHPSSVERVREILKELQESEM